MSTLTTEIEAAFAQYAAGWASNDGATVARTFTDDGSLINPFGERADGRDALAAMYGAYFAGMLRGTSTAFSLTHVRAVEQDHALADADQTICAPDGTVVLAVHITTLMRREGGVWRVADARPFTVMPPAPA